MRRTAATLVFTLAIAATVQAQHMVRQAGYTPQTALGALGQVNVLGAAPAGQAGYRVAARNGVAAAARQQQHAPGKPFSTSYSSPTISPYLNLFRDDAANGTPNYYAFVRPQQDQYETTRRQQAELQRLQNQLQQAGQAPRGASVAGGARYGDTGRYYSGWRR